MNEFNLEQFKKGVKARTRDGRTASYIGICEDCGHYNLLVAHIEGYCNVDTFNTNGTFMEYGTHKYDLVSMVSPWEGVPIGARVRVKAFKDSRWENRYFAGVNSQGEPTAWVDGATSWSAEDASTWDFMELVEE